MFVFRKIIIEDNIKILKKIFFFSFEGLYNPIINHFRVPNVFRGKYL